MSAEIELAFASRTHDHEKALKAAVTDLRKRYGTGAVMQLGSDEQLPQEVVVIPTGSLTLDIALGVGGIPTGRVIEIFGPESSGKTTLTLHVVAMAQAMGGLCAFIDAEHALDVDYARRLGVKTDDLLIAQPDSGEQALEIAENLIATGGLAVVVVDSVAALTPQAEIDGEMGDSHVGLQARLMSQALRKLTGVVSNSGTCLIFINQIRMKIGVMFGSPETTTGGNALKFYSSMRLDIRRKGTVKVGEGDEATGVANRTKVKVVKNKLAPPFREAEFDIRFGTGISREGEMLDLGLTHGLVTKNGNWYVVGENRLGNGREASIACLLTNPKMTDWLEDELRHHLKLGPRVPRPACMIHPETEIEPRGEFDHTSFPGAEANARGKGGKRGDADAR